MVVRQELNLPLLAELLHSGDLLFCGIPYKPIDMLPGNTPEPVLMIP